MQHKKLIQSEIEFNKTFRYITQAYEEIAVLKMRKVRASVLSTREYLSHLTEVFFDLKKAKEKQNQLAKLKSSSKDNTDKEKKTLINAEADKKNTSDKITRKVSVLLSANTTLYGDLIGRIFQLFLKNIKKDNSDLIIVGRVGKRMYDQQENKKPYVYFEIPDVGITLEELKPVIFHLVKYQKIQVYYGKFESIVTQKEISSNISGDNPYLFKDKEEKLANTDLKKDLNNPNFQYLFEPDLDNILAFFEDLIASSLFRQTVHETQLARWASRILSMEKAQTNIDMAIKKLYFSRTKIIKQNENQKQLNRLAGLSLWRR